VKVKRISLALALTLAVGLTGCAGLTRSEYTAPKLAVPAGWNDSPGAAVGQGATPPATIPGLAADTSGNARLGAASTVRALTLDGWWRSFGDADLDALIDQLLARNNDLAAATLRVRQAQLSAGLAADQLVPAASAGVSTSNGRSLGGRGTTSRSVAASASLAWEADLWGRLAAQRDAARWEAVATDEDRAATALSLVGTATRIHYDLGYLNERIALGDANIADARRTIELVQLQYAAGAVSSLEIDEARQTLAALQASQTTLLLQRDEDRHALAVLFDRPPTGAASAAADRGAVAADAAPFGESFAEPARLPSAALPDIPAGLPADLLARRPDLRAAESRLRSTLDSADATRLAYYPSFSLTGTLGSSSVALANVLSNPVATLGSGLTLPFLQQTERQLNIAREQAIYETAVITFRQTFYEALVEVQDALSARTQYDEQARRLEESLAAAQRTESAYELRYRVGAVALRTWLDAQRTRRDAEASLAANRLNRLLNRVTLHQALGGRAEI